MTTTSDYTVFANGNNFTPTAKLGFGDAIGKVADLLADTHNVREVTITRDGDATAMDPTPVMMIIDRRHDQLKAGHTPDHDDGHTGEHLALAAAAYASPESARLSRRNTWPWEPGEFHGDADRLDQLAEAGAFILAEMERITRARKRES